MLGKSRGNRFKEIDKNWLNRVQVRDLGPILWENEALPLISIFRPVLDQQNTKKGPKYAQTALGVLSQVLSTPQ